MTIDIKLHRKLDAEADPGDWIYVEQLEKIEAQAAEIERLKQACGHPMILDTYPSRCAFCGKRDL